MHIQGCWLHAALVLTAKDQNQPAWSSAGIRPVNYSTCHVMGHNVSMMQRKAIYTQPPASPTTQTTPDPASSTSSVATQAEPGLAGDLL